MTEPAHTLAPGRALAHRGGRFTVGQRLFLGLAPALLAVFMVPFLAYYGDYGRAAPEAVVIGAATLAVASLVGTWFNARHIARRIARLAGPASVAAREFLAEGGGEDELDRIEATVNRLGSQLSASRAERAQEQEAAELRLREEATLLASATAAAIGRLDDLRLPLHILLENKFGDLNENQVELLADARGAAELMDAELRQLRTIADADRGALTVTRELVQVNDVVRAVMPGAIAAARRGRARLDVTLEPVLPRVYADRARLHEALALLLKDAVARAGGRTTTLSTVRAGASVVVTIDAVAPQRLPEAQVAEDTTTRLPPGTPSPDVVLATRLLAVQGCTVRTSGERVEVTLVG